VNLEDQERVLHRQRSCITGTPGCRNPALPLRLADVLQRKGIHPVLPEYSVRESPRAKSVRLSVTVEDGLVVVVPKGFDRRRIPALLRTKERWLQRALEKVEMERLSMPSPDQRPIDIVFPAVSQRWQVVWDQTPDGRISLTQQIEGVLSIAGPVDDASAWRYALRGWLLEQGRRHLAPWLEELSRETGISAKRTTIRCQKTRWGSYSTKGTISLNAQLLFLPPQWVRYVLLHELCHVRQPNHSPDFWQALAQFEPEATRLRNELRHARRLVPSWLVSAARGQGANEVA
jgi:predicted metal-dependent hydrolase